MKFTIFNIKTVWNIRKENICIFWNVVYLSQIYHICIFKSGAGVKSGGEHFFGNHVRVFEHGLVGLGAADGGHDAFADAGDDRFFPCAADELLNACAHRDAGDRVKLNTVEGDCAYARRFNDFRVHGHLHRFEHVAPGEVDRRRLLEVELDVRLVRGDERLDHAEDVTARHVVRFEEVRFDGEPCLAAQDARVHDDFGRNFAEPHADELEHSHVRLGEQSLEPQAEKVRHESDENDGDDCGKDYPCDINSVHDKLLLKEPVQKLSYF